MSSMSTASMIPKDWTDAILVPIPKKGDMKRCDNWRGIALLVVVGKLIARVLQRRLQELAEDESLLSHSVDSGKGRSCTVVHGMPICREALGA